MENKTTDNIQKKTQLGVESLMGDTQRVKEYGEEKLIQLKEKANVMRKNFDTRISDNPEKSVLIAAGVGAVVESIATAALLRKRA